MAAPDLRGAVKAGLDILSTRLHPKTKKILCQLGDVKHETTDTDNAELWQHTGIVARPSKPQKATKAPQAVTISAGDHDIVIATQDERARELYGQLKEGETGLYAAGADGDGQARTLLKANGTVVMFTKKGNTKDGTGIQIAVNSDGSISIAGSEGNAVLLGSDGAVNVFNASGAFSIKPDGHVKVASGSKIEISGASVTLGGAAALPIAIGPNVVTAISNLQAQITALKVLTTAHSVAWAALGALTGPILGAMIVPIAAPIAGLEASTLANTIAGAVSTVATNLIIPSKRTSSD